MLRFTAVCRIFFPTMRRPVLVALSLLKRLHQPSEEQIPPPEQRVSFHAPLTLFFGSFSAHSFAGAVRRSVWCTECRCVEHLTAFTSSVFPHLQLGWPSPGTLTVFTNTRICEASSTCDGACHHKATCSNGGPSLFSP